jgi:hypothetical protein
MRLACRHEPEAARAVREGRWTDALASHLVACASCQEAARVAAWLQAVAHSAEADAAPADPGRVWSRGVLAREVARRQELARRAARPAVWFQRVAALLATAATVAWMATSEAELDRLTTYVVDPPTDLGPWSLVLTVAAFLALAFVAGAAALDRLQRP